MAAEIEFTRAALRTPRAAAIAGIVFALLLGAALVLLRVAVPENPSGTPDWLDDGWRRSAVVLALNLVPFAGLAFLWFIGVIRDRIGAAEDRFFATESQDGSGVISPEVWRLGRHTSYTVLNVYAMRMAGAFAIVTTTIAARIGIFPRWLTGFGWVVAVVLLVTVERFAWVQILFPIWVLVLSAHLLVRPPGDQVR